MRILAIVLLTQMVASCATAPVEVRPDFLFKDQLFSAPSERIDANDVFAVNDKMRHYLNTEIAGQLRAKGTQQGLVDALYNKNQLKVDYDSAITRNAAQTFDERAGNCLSLVIMTAALAKELGMPVGFQRVLVDETWARRGGLYFSIGHVNLTVSKPPLKLRSKYDDNALFTIDFLPLGETRGQRSLSINKETVIAMYMNNRAGEAIARGQLDDAYWWAREAIRQSPSFLSSYNTLGVLYRRHGNLAEAEVALNYAFQRGPERRSPQLPLRLGFRSARRPCARWYRRSQEGFHPRGPRAE